MTILFVLASTGYVLWHFLKMFDTENANFTSNGYLYDSSLFKDKSMNEFHDSFNLFVGIEN